GEVGELVELLGEPSLRRREAEADHTVAGLDRVAETAEDQVCRARRARTEDTDRVEPAVRGDRPDDPRTRGAVATDVPDLVVHDRHLVIFADDGDRTREGADQRVGRIDAAVHDADVDLSARAAERPVARYDSAPRGVGGDRGRLAGRQAPGGNGARAHV